MCMCRRLATTQPCPTPTHNSPVFEAMTPEAPTEPAATATPCPNLQSLALGEFLSPPAFAALNR